MLNLYELKKSKNLKIEESCVSSLLSKTQKITVTKLDTIRITTITDP